MRLHASRLCVVLAWLLLPPAVAAADEVVVMSYNILRPEWAKPGDPAWADRVGGVARIIETHGADLVGLQEETAPMVADLLGRLRDYAYLYPVPEKGAGLLFRYRVWVPLAVRRAPAPGGREIVEALFLGPAGRRLYVYAAHFSPFEETLRLEAAALLARMIADRAEPAVPVVVTGDLNASPTSPPLRHLTQDDAGPRLQDVFSALGLASPRTASTYREPWTSTGLRLDHVLFAGGLRPLRAQAIDDRAGGFFPSDHLPVLAVFKWVDEAGLIGP